MLNYRNTPLRNTGRSPAQIVTGRQLRDHLATNPESYKPSKEWQVIKEQEILLLSSPSFKALICLGKPQVWGRHSSTAKEVWQSQDKEKDFPVNQLEIWMEGVDNREWPLPHPYFNFYDILQIF